MGVLGVFKANTNWIPPRIITDLWKYREHISATISGGAFHPKNYIFHAKWFSHHEKNPPTRIMTFSAFWLGRPVSRSLFNDFFWNIGDNTVNIQRKTFLYQLYFHLIRKSTNMFSTMIFYLSCDILANFLTLTKIKNTLRNK